MPCDYACDGELIWQFIEEVSFRRWSYGIADKHVYSEEASDIRSYQTVWKKSAFNLKYRCRLITTADG